MSPLPVRKGEIEPDKGGTGATLQPGNAPSWIAAFAVMTIILSMTKGGAGSTTVIPVFTGIYAPILPEPVLSPPFALSLS